MIQNIGHDEHVDIWCLGVLLFELLTGTPPFIGQNRVLLMKNIINVNISWPSPPRLPIDPDAKDLISKILKKKPTERISLENIVKHNFFIKYCPNIKPILNKKQKYHLKPFIVSKDIPNDDYYDYENDDEKNEKNNFDLKPSLKYLVSSSNKKNKYRDITPSPPGSKLNLEKKIKSNSSDINILSHQNTKTQLKVFNNSKKIDMAKGDDETIRTFSIIRDAIKENEKLKKENENFKLREIGYNKKIEELTFALNNLSQENMLLKMNLDNYKKELEKKKKEINILRSSRNLNLNLNNQTTFNINTSSSRSNNYKGLNNLNSSRKKNNNTIIRTFISKTPEGLQRKGRRVILTNNMKPYLKKNAILNKSNKSIDNEILKDEEMSNSNSNNNSNKISKKESANINDDNLKLNKNVSCNDILDRKNKKHKYYKESKEKEKQKEKEKGKERENYINMIMKLKKENEALKEENQRIKKNNYKSLNKDK